MEPSANEPDLPRKAKILVADDEEPIRVVQAKVLEDIGHHVFQASNGDEALALAREHHPDLVLLDIKMPGLSGIEVCRALRADTPTRAIRIIVVSGLDARVALEESIIAGADDFLQKPFEIVELLVRVRSMLRVLNIEDEGQRVETYIKTLQALRGKPTG